MDDVNELCLAPFRKVLDEANLAMEKAGGNEQMRRAAHMLCVAGEFALKVLEVPCARRYRHHDKRFVDALRDNGEIRELRNHLDQQVYIFHRHMMSSDFDAEKYAELETVTSDVRLKMHEVVINMNLDSAPLGFNTSYPSLNQLPRPSSILSPNYPPPVTPPCTSIGSSPSEPPGPLPGSPGPIFQNPTRASGYSGRRVNGELAPCSARRSRTPSHSPSPRPSIPMDNVDPQLVPEDHGRGSIFRPDSQSASDCAIDAASSFHLVGGFCRGAERVILGDAGVRKPRWIAEIMGSSSEARCTACKYKLSCQEIEADDSKQSAPIASPKLVRTFAEHFIDSGNQKQSGVRYRLRFLRKSHVRWERPDDVLYACVFCVRAGRTIDPSDPTVFLSTENLFLHIARHARPLPAIPGFVIIEAPNVPPEHHNDYDLHFPEPALAHPVLERERHVASRPKAVTTELTRKLYRQEQLPDKSRLHEVLVGARITGLEWPDKYKGEWCSGWHDGAYGSIPFSILQLEPPSASDVQVDGTSRVKAKARFKFSHKDRKKTRWLKFDKNEIITNISWAYPAHWCWSGINSKGDRGIFPKAFVMEIDCEIVI
ncbi:hypothetical protein LLEC1_06486 [Akanthomyces lecanii]|uniref:SH3 domain-containing protein n=1 Tax=Cordyceps confragosa TaxID=2714763 RepID=A0A179IM04_CORDF|nr:hypothetical protein LLEC1_06486 [Akanthomyces lecanii]